MLYLGSMVRLCAALVLLSATAAAQGASGHASVGRKERVRGQDLDDATQQVALMSFRADRIHNWLRDARGKGRVARSRCLDDKLSMAHALERQGHGELAAVQRAVTRELPSKPHLVRIGAMAEQSAKLVARAGECGKTVSRRARTPTEYRVRVIAPRLPPPDQRASKPRRPRGARTARK